MLLPSGFSVAMLAGLTAAGHAAGVGWPYYAGVAAAGSHLAWQARCAPAYACSASTRITPRTVHELMDRSSLRAGCDGGPEQPSRLRRQVPLQHAPRRHRLRGRGGGAADRGQRSGCGSAHVSCSVLSAFALRWQGKVQQQRQSAAMEGKHATLVVHYTTSVFAGSSRAAQRRAKLRGGVSAAAAARTLAQAVPAQMPHRVARAPSAASHTALTSAPRHPSARPAPAPPSCRGTACRAASQTTRLRAGWDTRRRQMTRTRQQQRAYNCRVTHRQRQQPCCAPPAARLGKGASVCVSASCARAWGVALGFQSSAGAHRFSRRPPRLCGWAATRAASSRWWTQPPRSGVHTDKRNQSTSPRRGNTHTCALLFVRPHHAVSSPLHVRVEVLV
jgi:hypothetical protein